MDSLDPNDDNVFSKVFVSSKIYVWWEINEFTAAASNFTLFGRIPMFYFGYSYFCVDHPFVDTTSNDMCNWQ